MKSARWLAFVTLLGAVSFGACDRPEWKLSDERPVAGSGSGGFGGVAGGNPCAIDRSQGTMPVFAAQTVMNTSPARIELYAYVTDAEAEQLRSSRTLLPTAPVPNNGAVQQLNRAVFTVSAARRPFVESLAQRFTRTRSTWPNPWALRLVSRPASEHMNPVRIVLKKEAWIIRPDGTSLAVVDVNNLVVPDTGPLDPDRVAAVFVPASSSSGIGCESGFRELALGNEAMVESWELGSAAIAARLSGDIELLTRFFAVVRQCNDLQLNKGGSSFHSATVCSTWMSSVAASEYTTYAWSLSTPVEQYRPSVQNITTLITALEGDRFEPDPFVVKPAPSGGAGGVGGGGAGGVGALGGGGQGGALGDAGEAGAAVGGEGGSGGVP